MQALIEFKSIYKRFDKKILLDNVSFSLNKGEITTLIGQNGAGKTTIAKIILGLESSDAGELIITDNISIGYVPQSLNLNFNMPMTAYGLLEVLSGKKDSVLDLNLPFINDIEQIKNHDLSEISGGQMQKILLAGTIMSKPDLIILDEPTQFLDVTSQQEFYQMIGKIKNELGITIFMISHDLFTVMKNSDKVICLNKHVCCSGKPSEINSNDVFKDALSEIGVYIHHHDHIH